MKIKNLDFSNGYAEYYSKMLGRKVYITKTKKVNKRKGVVFTINELKLLSRRRVIEMSEEVTEKYKNTYGWCMYPFHSNDPIDFCWGYANEIDNGATKEEILEGLCKGCVFFNGSDKR